MEEVLSLGNWIRQRRKALDLTQEALARLVGCAAVTLQKIELEERRPSREIAERLAEALDLPPEERAAFVKVARAELATGWLPVRTAREAQTAPAAKRCPQTATTTPVVNGEEAPAPGEAPFRGLRAFEEADAGHFFGREALTARLAGHLRDHSFLAVVGASGSGKSSLVRAGLIPALRSGERLVDGTLPPAGSIQWPLHIITPTAHPLEALALTLTSDANSPTATTTLIDDFARDPRILHIVARKLLSRAGLGDAGRGGNGSNPAPRLLLVVDQFEELFTLCRGEVERAAFVDNLLFATASETGGSISVVLTLRADFYAHCAQYAGLREALAARQAYIGPMSGEELRRAIEEPARRDGWEIEPGLVDLLLREVGDEPGALPLLSHALLETWKRRRGRRLTLAGYREAGGVREAIARTAERVYEELTPQQQAVARRIFLRLTELGEGTQDTRRRAPLDELIPASEDGAVTADVLRRLADARLITLAEASAEVAHEALIREWPALREWLLENREGLRLQRHVTEAAHDWDRLERDPGALYRGARLTRAAEWASTHAGDLTGLEREFLEASREQAQEEAAEREARQRRELDEARQRADEQARAAQQLRRRAVLLASTALVAGVLAIAALLFGQEAGQNARLAAATRATAEAERGRAEDRARFATSREWAAVANNNLEADPERSILLALQALSVTHTREAEEALHRALLASRVRHTLAGHTDAVTDVSFSPDGARLATAGHDRTVRIWDTETGGLKTTLRASDPQRSVVFSPDGKRVAGGGEYGTVRMWDVETGEGLRRLYTESGVRALAWSTDGKLLASGTKLGTMALWDTASGEKLRTFPGGNPVRSIAFSVDGRQLIKLAEGGSVTAWDIATDERRGDPLFSLPDDEPSDDVALSQDGTRMAMTSGTGTITGTVAIWDVATGSRPVSIRFPGSGHIPTQDRSSQNQVYRVTFSSDGRRLATTNLDGTVNVWDASSGQELLTVSGHQSAILNVSFSPDGRYLATTSTDQTARVWDLGPNAEAAVAPVSEGSGGMVVSHDGTRLASGSRDGTARVWDARSGAELLTLTGHHGPISAVSFNQDGTRLATASGDRTVCLWDATTGRLLYTLSGYSQPVNSVAFTADGARLITGGSSLIGSNAGMVKVWDAKLGSLQDSFYPAIGRINAVAFTADGARFATASDDRTSHIFDTTSGDELAELVGHTSLVLDVAWSPDGSRLATASADWTAKVWDTQTGEAQITLSGHTDSVAGVAFSPDGAHVATAGRDGMLKLWDAATGDLLLTLAADQRPLSGVAFSPDGARLITSSDNALRVYLLRLEDLVGLARTRVTRSLTPDECRRHLRLEQCPALP